MKSFIEYSKDCHFPIQNLPYGVFNCKNNKDCRVGVAIGELVLDLSVLEKYKILGTNYFAEPTLNKFMDAGKNIWDSVRSKIQNLLLIDNPTIRDNKKLYKEVFLNQNEVVMHLPAKIGDYTDFYSSKQHATNVGKMFRDPDNALLPNWLHLPVGYHGRSSSIVISGTPIRRPVGQILPNNSDKPILGPSKLLDFELEMGCFIGPGNTLGKPIDINDSGNHLFGLVLVNDWSARDIQKWEYVPLGPFLAKNFATSISPWIIPFAALDEFRINNPVQVEPKPLSYLNCKEKWTFDINLEIYLNSDKCLDKTLISRSNYKYMYWNLAQQLAHHTITGCNIKSGDLFASGTISGESENSYGSMLELSWKGTKPVKLNNGQERKFINDGDTVMLTGYGQGDGYKIGFGEVKGKIFPPIKSI